MGSFAKKRDTGFHTHCIKTSGSLWLPKKDSPSPAGETEAALTAHRAVIHSRFVRILGIKNRHPPHGECLLWLPKKDSPSPAGEAEAALTAHRAVIHSRFVRILGIKNRHPPHGECLLWLPKKDSNPHKQSQSLSCYHYTIRQCGYYYTA